MLRERSLERPVVTARLAGRISGWNDEKGYGFVVPHEGGDRAFVHVKAFRFGSRRPVDGDLISYTTSKDARGRINARDARIAGQRPGQRRSPTPVPRRTLGAAFLAAVLLGTALGKVPFVIPAGYAVLGCLSYLMYFFDKAAAAQGRSRTPENTLHLVDLLGGWPGALFAQQQFRHKTAKASFQSVFWTTAVVNIAVVAWLVHSGKARLLAGALPGL